MKPIKINRLLILTFVLCLILFSVAVYFAINLSKNDLQEKVGENSILSARNIVNSIDRLIDRRIERWQSYIYEPEIRPTLEGTLYEDLKKSNSQFESMGNMKEYISNEDSKWKSASEQEITPFMYDLINNSISNDLRRVTSFYEEKNSYNLFPEVFITNKYGVNVAQTGKTSDYYQGDEEWWQTANKEGFYISDFGYDESSKTYSIEFALRIEDSKKNPLGVILVVYDIKDLTNLIDNIHSESELEYSSTDIKIISKEQKVIYSSDKGSSIIYEPISENIKTIFNLNKSYGYFIAEENKNDIPIKTLYSYYTSEGYKDFKGLGEILVIKYATKDVFRSLEIFQGVLLLTFIIMFSISFVLFIYIAKFISVPLKELDNRIKEITKGNLNIDTNVKVNVFEIQSLIESLNRILASLKLAIFRTGTSKESFGLGEAIKAKEEAEKRYKELFDGAIDAIFIADPVTRKLVDCNRAAEKLVDYSKKEILSMEADELHPKDLVEETMRGFKKQVKGTINILLSEVLTKDKKRIPVSINASTVQIGNKIYLQGMFRDISLQKEIERKYKILYETSKDALMTLAPPKWNFTSGNPTTVKMFKVKDEKQFISLPPWKLSPKYQPDGQLSVVKAKNMIEKAMKEGSNFFEWTHKRYNGENFPALVLLSRVKEDGHSYLQATVRDITTTKKLEGRETMVGKREETAKGREEVVGKRESVAKGRETMVGKREKIKKGIGREGIAKGREEVVGKRENVATGRETMVGKREETAKGREEKGVITEARVTRREGIAKGRENVATGRESKVTRREGIAKGREK